MTPTIRLATLLAFALSLLPVSVLFAQVSGLAGWNIYLDPGHSQQENVGVFGYSEAQKNLRVALALRQMLLETTDIDTVFISRTNDSQSVGLSQRSDHANSLGAAWFHSIHSDAASPSANSTLLLWGQTRSGQEKVPPGGKALSDIMVKNLSDGMRIGSRGSIGDCSFYGCSSQGPYLSVNRRTTMPSELSEAGFHTNPTQNQLNMNAEWKVLEAKTFYWSILDFHNLARPAEQIVAGIVTDLETGLPVNGATIESGARSYTTDSFESLFRLYSTDPEQLRNGFFYLADMPSGLLPLQLSAPGYRSLDTEVTAQDSFFTFVDLELISMASPVVATTSPAQADTAFRITNPIIISFSRPMDRPSVESAFSIEPATSGAISWGSNDTRFAFVPDSLSPETDYQLSIAETAKGRFDDAFDGDADGAAGGDFTLLFRTGLRDVEPPRVVDFFPAPNSFGARTENVITVTYQEPVLPSTVTSSRFTLSIPGQSGTVNGVVLPNEIRSTSVVTFYPEVLQPETTYNFRIFEGVEDKFGNVDTARRTFVFQTGESVADEITSIDNFESSLEHWWVPQQSGTTTGIVTDSTSRSVDLSLTNLSTGSNASMRLDYGWDLDAPSSLVRVFLESGSPKNVEFDATWVVEAFVFGDGSGTRIRFALDDNLPTVAAANHEVSPWYAVDWYGWRLVSWDLSEGITGSWIGDRSVDGRVRFDSIQLAPSDTRTQFGSIWMDDLRIYRQATGTPVEEDPELPSTISLAQNYPNPFNPSTAITYSLPRPAAIVLEVYDATGRQVTRLDEGMRSAGTHLVEWNAGEFASGLYIYRLTADGTAISRKMLLLK